MKLSASTTCMERDVAEFAKNSGGNECANTARTPEFLANSATARFQVFCPRFLACVLALLIASPPAIAQDQRSITDSVGISLHLLPAGRFEMGERDAAPGFSRDHTSFSVEDESPVHPVVLTRPFYLATTEVTVGQFRQFVEATGYRTTAEQSGEGIVGWDPTTPPDLPSYQWAFRQKPEFTWRNPGFPQEDSHPVVGVSWDDAQAFCRWLSEKEHVPCRLPTEAEWEYACRAGTTTYFSFGDAYRHVIHERANIGNVELERVAPRRATRQWIFDPDKDSADPHVFTAPVASYPANPWGLCDLHGNVWEWCADRYLDTFYTQFDRDGYQQPRKRAIDPLCDDRWNEQGEWRVIRGGSWFNAPRQARSSSRGYFEARDAACYVGFRVARDAPDEQVVASRQRFDASEAARESLKQVVGAFREERDGRLTLRLRGEQLSDEVIRALQTLDEPVDLVIDGQNRVTAATLEAIAGIPDLRGLSLSSPAAGLQDADLADLARHPELEVLQISGTPDLTDTVIEHIAGLTQLERLELQGREITDAGLARLPPLPKLRRLHLAETQSEGMVLEQFAGAPLEVLSLRHLTDAGAPFLEQFPRLEHLDIHGSPLTGRGFASIARLPRLRTLEMAQCRHVDDAGFAALTSAAQLATLNLSETQAGDAAAEAISELNQLSNLRIGSAQLSDAGLRRLCLTVSLEHLVIRAEVTAVTDAGLSDLWRLRRLRSLYLYAPHITGSGLSALAELPDLASLTLSGAALTDAALRRAAACQNLEQLTLGDWGPGGPPNITDAGLVGLAAAPRLRRIHLLRKNTRISDDAIARLRQAAPELSIDVRE